MKFKKRNAKTLLNKLRKYKNITWGENQNSTLAADSLDCADKRDLLRRI